MISSKIVCTVAKTSLWNPQRNISVAKVLYASDPIQKLFVEKIQEFRKSGGKVDVSPEVERERKNELERVAKQYGGGSGVDLTQFPSFKFQDPQIDPISSGN